MLIFVPYSFVTLLNPLGPIWAQPIWAQHSHNHIEYKVDIPDWPIDKSKLSVIFLLFSGLWQNTCQWVSIRSHVWQCICHWASRDIQTVIVSTYKSNSWSMLPQLQMHHKHYTISAVASQLLRFYFSQFTVNACEKFQSMAQHRVRHCTDLWTFVVRSWAA